MSSKYRNVEHTARERCFRSTEGQKLDFACNDTIGA